MCPKIDSRVADRCGNDPVEPAAPPVKKCAVRGNDRVGYNVPGRKRRPRTVTVRLIRKTDARSLDKRQKLGTHPLQLHHPDAFYLLGPMTIKSSFQYSCKQLRTLRARSKQITNARPLNPPKKNAPSATAMNNGFQIAPLLSAAISKSNTGFVQRSLMR